ncbi:MAG: ATP-binding protein [Thermosynechococcaceae cyanobacterium]
MWTAMTLGLQQWQGAEVLSNLFSSRQYMPHGHCYLWQAPLVGLHVVSDLLIAIAYYSIPGMLLYFVFKRRDAVPFQSFFVFFGAFIVFCGTGHLLEIWTLWHPAYWLSGIEKGMTALISCYTAGQMVTLLPQFLSLKTPEELEGVNRQLQAEIGVRQAAEAQLRHANEDLELRVQERTVELSQAAERERAITRIVQQMRKTLDLQTIFTDTVDELRTAVDCDRVLIYQFNPDWSGRMVAESVADGWPSLIDLAKTDASLTRNVVTDGNCAIQSIRDTYLQEQQGGAYTQKGSYRVVNDVYAAQFDPCYLNLLERIQVKSYIVAPIFQQNVLWGLLFTYQLSAPRQWTAAAAKITTQIGTQLGIAIQQAELLSQTQQHTRDLQIAKEDAERSNQAKSTFLANMSHELRTPLNAILGYAQLLQRASDLSPDHQEYVQTIDRSGEHLLNLINDILEVSIIEAGQHQLNETSFDLYQLLDNLEKMLALRANIKQLSLSFVRQREVPQYIKADAQKLRQILINLLGNAVKFTAWGQVTLQVTVIEDRLQFSIEDTGPGIAPEDIDQLFKAFVQTEVGLQAAEGTGLGLLISRGFVELMGGHMHVSSQLGQGSTFSFDLPLQQTESVATQQREIVRHNPSHLAPGQPEFRILVAEDRLVNRTLLVDLLRSVGFVVREACNGKEAVEIWHEWQPQAIWMDMQMPIMSGYVAAQKIKAAPGGQSTVIFALTASAFEEQRADILNCGCDDFVRKPFRVEEIYGKLAQSLGVQYVFEEPEGEDLNRNATASVSPQLAPALTAESFAMMPPSWIEAMSQHAVQGDDLQLLKLVDEIPQEYHSTAQVMTGLIENFQFENILELIQAPV